MSESTAMLAIVAATALLFGAMYVYDRERIRLHGEACVPHEDDLDEDEEDGDDEYGHRFRESRN